MTARPLSTMRSSQGFTFIELMITIGILGILSAIVLGVLQPAFFFGKGRDSRRQSDLQNVRAGLEQYYLDNGRVYPADTGTPATDFVNLETPLGPYLDAFPVDPGSNTYNYETSADQKCYELSVDMEVETPSPYTACGGSLACQADNSYCP